MLNIFSIFGADDDDDVIGNCVICGHPTGDVCHQCGDPACESCLCIHEDVCPAGNETTIECPDCDGKGFWLGLVHRHECKKCQGYGRVRVVWSSKKKP